MKKINNKISEVTLTIIFFSGLITLILILIRFIIQYCNYFIQCSHNLI